MPEAPVPLFLTLAVGMVLGALAVSVIRVRWLGVPRKRCTNLAWALVAAVVAYFLVQGYRHA